MRILYSIVLAMLIPFVIKAQEINGFEYFLDTDPGIGHATFRSFTPAANVQENVILPLGLQPTPGFHIIGFRTSQSGGKWSQTSYRPYLQTISNPNLAIVASEFFIDSDPGQGFGNSFGNFQATTDVNGAFSAALQSLAPGFHIIGIRSLDSKGSWSQTLFRPFLQLNPVNSLNVMATEYFIDSDPGNGNASSLGTIQAASDVIGSFSKTLQNLAGGFHIIGIRSRDSKGAWSQTAYRPFLKTNPGSNVKIVQAEYWIDSDPGNGLGVLFAGFQPDTNIIATFSASLQGLSQGFHVIGTRTKDTKGAWSHTAYRPFLIKNGRMDTAKMLGGEYAFDTDPGIGSGTAFSFNGPFTTIVSSFICNANTSNLTDGHHTLLVRTKTTNGIWSMTDTAGFTKGTASRLAAHGTVVCKDSNKLLKADVIDFVLFPNPTTDNVTILLSETVNNLKVRVIDMQGKTRETLIELMGPKLVKINLSDLPAGTYQVNLSANGFGKTMRIVKK